MNNISATVNPRELLLMFAELDSKNQKKAHKTALINSSRILVNEAKLNFRSVVKKPNSRNRWNGRSFISGIKYSIDRDVTTSKIHIMGDRRIISDGNAHRSHQQQNTKQQWQCKAPDQILYFLIYV